MLQDLIYLINIVIIVVIQFPNQFNIQSSISLYYIYSIYLQVYVLFCECYISCNIM